MFTSTEAGDLRRALLSAERLVLVRADHALERRDYAVALLHAGRLGEARLEMRTFAGTAEFSKQR